MSEEPSNEIVEAAQNKSAGKMTQIVYFLYLAAIVIPFASVVGVIMAYVSKGDGPEWMQSHYQFQIRTFWISLLLGFIGAALTAVVIGFIVLLALLVWYILRCVKGLKYLDQQVPVPDPKTWTW
ncbi:DUF4870 family protein [Sneathiella glossodoripedis]|uniref:DUF4870 family protein n=1 Tax=Sneathiella glossodoripedis TaxID=418853 RepID=UPI0004717943|nr:membrane protein [Sneathiella glossodoripedis]